MKKAQAAMEFLMTYGWAILIVLAAVGILAYAGVLKPQSPTICQFHPAFVCFENPGASAGTNGGEILIPLRSSLFYDAIDVSADSPSCDPGPTLQIDQGGEGKLTLINCGFLKGQRYRESVEITYTASAADGGSGMEHKTTGEVGGTFGP